MPIDLFHLTGLLGLADIGVHQTTAEFFAQQVVNGLLLGSIYALIALGYTMVYGVLRLINFAHGDVFMVGAFVTFLTVNKVLGSGQEPSWWLGLLALLLSMLACGVLGVLIERFAYRPVRNAPRLTPLITAIGVSLFLENLGVQPFVFGASPQFCPAVLPNDYRKFEFANVLVSRDALLLIGATLILLAMLWYVVSGTKLGKAIRAVSFDREAASLMGINIDNVISYTFFIGSALAGAGAFLFAALTHDQITPYMGIMPGVKAFVAAVLGGIGNIPGAALGGFIMGLAETMVRGYAPAAHIPSSYSDAVAFLILIVILLVRPSGLLGEGDRGKGMNSRLLPRQFGFFALLILVLLALNAGSNWLIGRDYSFYNSYTEDVLLRAGIYVILAVSLNLVNGFTGQFSIGHAGLYGLGAYTGALVSMLAQATFLSRFAPAGGDLTWFNGGVLLVLSMLSGGIVAALAGWLIGLPSLKLRGDYLAIVTLGFNQIIVVVLQSIDYVGGARGLSGVTYKGNSLSIPMLTSFFWVYLVAAIVIILSINLRRSVQGLAFLSIRENEIAAEAMGIPTTRIKVTAFVIAAFFAGVAGSLFAHEQGFFKPDNFNFITSINIVVMVVLGGMGSVTGTAIGALLLTILPEELHSIDQYRLVIYALLLILLMLMRPQGIFGSEEFSRVWLANQWNGLKSMPRRIAARWEARRARD